MTEDRLPLAELLAKAGEGDFLRGVAQAVVQSLMETDVEGLIGAGRQERTAERATYRTGTGRWKRARDPCNCVSPSYGRTATSRRSWKPARRRKRPLWPSSKRPGSAACGRSGASEGADRDEQEHREQAVKPVQDSLQGT